MDGEQFEASVVAAAQGEAPPAGGIRPLLHRIGHYASGSVAAMAFSMISYPLFTRVLTVEDYGIMGLIQVILLGSVATAKLGLQNSLIRFWPAHGDHPEGRVRFVSTFFFASLALGSLVALLCFAAAALLRNQLPARLALPLAIGAFLIPVRALFSYAQNLLRARDRSRTFAWTTILTSVIGLPLAALLVLLVFRGPHALIGLYSAVVVAEGLVVVLALRAALDGTPLQARRVDRKLLLGALVFGAPLLLFELASITLHFGDRVILEVFRSERELGFYTAAFSLAWQLAMLWSAPLELAVVPAFTNAWEREGPAAAQALIGRVHRLYMLVAFPAIAGLWAVRSELMTVLASHKYADAGAFLPVLFTSFLIFGSRTYVGAGLFLAKESRTAGLVALAGAVLNIGLNLVAVPRFGAHGSAVATSLASFAMVFALGWRSRRVLKFDLALGRMALYAAAAAGMGLLVARVKLLPADATAFGPHLLHLVVRVLLGAVIWAAFVVVVEPGVRTAVVQRVRATLRLKARALAVPPGR